MSAVRFFVPLVRPYLPRLIIATVSLVLTGGISLILPALGGNVVDAALTKSREEFQNLDTIILTLFGVFAVQGVLEFVETYALRSAAVRLLADLRGRLHAHLLALSPAFFESQRTGDLLSRLNSDVDEIGSALTGNLVSGFQQGLVFIGTLAILFTVHRGLTLFTLAVVPPVIVAAVVFGLRFQKLAKERQTALAEASVVAEETIAGIRTVQAFAREPEERARYRSKLEHAIGISLRAARVWGAFGGVMSFLAFSALALVLWRGGKLVAEDALTPGKLTSFLLYTFTLAGAIGSLTALWGNMKTAAGATERVRGLLETKPLIEDAPGALPLARARGKIELRNVDFAYATQEGRKALAGIDLAIEPGQSLALVGPSGAGKSTLVSLLLRFHDPTSGAVLIDDVDVRRYRTRDLRGAIGLVPQEILLFAGTVAENIRYGQPGATPEQVQAAAEAAQAHAFIEKLPQKYDSLVGERGVKLSAGERQRIALARVFLKDPGIVVLDEATSSLDAESEHLVQAALARLLEGRTTVLIAHRLATVRRAHRVVLVDQGKIAESGTHEELLARNGLYRRLCELQMLA